MFVNIISKVTSAKSTVWHIEQRSGIDSILPE